MSKRLTIRAAERVERLAEVQLDIKKLKEQLRALEAEENELHAQLESYFEPGATHVTYEGRVHQVDFAVTQRTILNQQKARAMIAKFGKRAPESTINVIHFSAKAI